MSTGFPTQQLKQFRRWLRGLTTDKEKETCYEGAQEGERLPVLLLQVAASSWPVSLFFGCRLTRGCLGQCSF
ncbi:protein of unknown function [Pseudomonas marincola]|uniref:Uncharacterized protein n=1 Tax=Pseudomonas marincola TaxID=437900 RepID=A0A8S2BBD7_9PSED|nr:protein of unknown function [Pseudomonas marincola]